MNMNPGIVLETRSFVITIFLSLIQLQVFSQQTYFENIDHGGLEREYIIYIPAIYTGNSPVPLVFNFHGRTQYNNSFMSQADFRPIADTAGFILVYPQGTINQDGDPFWNSDLSESVDDIGFTEVMMEQISSQYNIDTSRIYMTGYSNGADLCHAIACRLNDKIASIAPVKGKMPEYFVNRCWTQHQTPVLSINNTDDIFYPFKGRNSVEETIQFWVNRNECDLIPTTTIFPDIDSNDNITVEHIVYTCSEDGVTVELIKEINNAGVWGHNYPVITSPNSWYFDGPGEVWKFLSRYSLENLRVIVGIEEINERQDQVLFYPNPTSAWITIKNEFSGPIFFEIFSIQGKRKIKGVLNYPIEEINLSTLPSNVYILKIGNRAYRFLKN